MRRKSPTLVGILVLIVTACGVGSGRVSTEAELQSGSTTHTTAAAETTVAGRSVDEPDDSAFDTAQSTLDAWADAISRDDVAAALANHEVEPDQLDSVRERLGYLAATIPHAEFSECEFAVVTLSDQIQATCALTLMDPILVEVGKETVVVPWTLTGDGSSIVDWQPGNRLSPDNPFVSYSLEHYPDGFANDCGPDTVEYEPFVGWAFNRACGEFTASIAQEIVTEMSTSTGLP